VVAICAAYRLAVGFGLVWQPTFQPTPMNVLALNACHGDASAALFVDRQLMAAVEEEQVMRDHYAEKVE
jgi:hypothetical protein